MANVSQIDWNTIVSQQCNPHKLARRKLIKKTKRSWKRRKRALKLSKNHPSMDDHGKSESIVKNSNTFLPMYDYIVYESVLLVLDSLITLVCSDAMKPSNFSSSAEFSAEPTNSLPTLLPGSASSVKINRTSATSTSKPLPHGGNENKNRDEADLEKTLATEKFLEELDEEVKKWHNPFLPESATNENKVVQENLDDVSATSNQPNILQNNEVNNPKELCKFYQKVGACRFGDNCSRFHPLYESSSTLLLHGMFSTYAFEIMERAQKNIEGDISDFWLEHSDSDLYDEFVEFYDDVLPELESYGKVVQFKVCCNRDKHLSGNVYVQYKQEKDAKKAAEQLRRRFYGGKILNVKFISIVSWKKAICGLHYHNRACPRGHHCNFLHVFKEPSRRFYDIDRDIVEDSHHIESCDSDRKIDCRQSSSRSPYFERQRSHRYRYRSPHSEPQRSHQFRSRSPYSERRRPRSRSRSPYSAQRKRRHSRSGSPCSRGSRQYRHQSQTPSPKRSKSTSARSKKKHKKSHKKHVKKRHHQENIADDSG